MKDSPVHDLSGTVLGGYQVQRVLGRGGMATVYAAYQMALQREIAIKVVHQNFTGSDPTFFTRFEREALTTAKLSHPFILPVFDYGQDRGYVYLTMPAMSESLRDYMRAKHLLSLAEIVRILDQIASALDYAHQAQIVHRDLKPSNILLDGQHDCRLSDFGIAHLMSERITLTATGAWVGTPAYMSPEQWNGSAVGIGSDLYSLGVLLYELVCGKLPFRGQSVAAMMTMHLNTAPVPIARKDLPDAAMAVILKSLAKTPNARYPSAFELASAFSAAVRESRAESVRFLLTTDDAMVATDSSTIQVAEPQTVMLVQNVPSVPGTAEHSRPAQMHSLSLKTFRRSISISLAILILLAVGLLLYNRSRPTASDAQKLNEAGLITAIPLLTIPKWQGLSTCAAESFSVTEDALWLVGCVRQ